MREPTDRSDLRGLPILREIGVELRTAAAVADEHDAVVAVAHTRRRRRSVRLATTALLAGLVAATAVIVPGAIRRGPSLNVVAAASAALSSEGRVVHVVMTGGDVQPDGAPVGTGFRERGRTVARLGRRIEQWSAGRPSRFKIDTAVLTLSGRPLGTLESGLAADGSGWEAQNWPGGKVSIDPNTKSAAVDNISEPDAPDAATALDRLLERGAFKKVATTSIDGRRVVELVAATTGAGNGQGGFTADTQTRYFVDADTFAPVRIEGYFRPPLHFGPGISKAVRERTIRENSGFVLTSRLDVMSYERIPLDQADPDLFRPPPAPGGTP